MSASLRLEGLGCVRGGRTLFTGLDIALAPGDAALVSGPNGVGKSSLLRVIAGLLGAQAGSVKTDGKIGFTSEQIALDRDRPLANALLYWARLDGCGRDAVDESMDAMALGRLADVPVRMLSTGQRKRAVLARVIAASADIWLLDEPSNGLDEESVERLETAIAAHRAEGGIVVAATHQKFEMPNAMPIMLGGNA